jgi:aspartyl/asparaginyl-tRNA synthetase
MEEGRARTLALLCSVAGLVIIYFSSTLVEQASAPVEINTLSLDDVGTSAKVCGSVAGAKTSKGNIFLQMQDNTSSVRLVIFNSTASRMDIGAVLNLSSICALGQVQEYPPGSGEIELIVNKVV